MREEGAFSRREGGREGRREGGGRGRKKEMAFNINRHKHECGELLYRAEIGDYRLIVVSFNVRGN